MKPWSPRKAESRNVKFRVERRSRPRPQRVRFRRRYASSLMRQLTSHLWTVLQLAFIGAVLVGGGLFAFRFWKSSPALKITQVTFKGDIPERLKPELARLVSKNILSLRPAKLEREFLLKFTELKNLSIRRHWDRSVNVTGAFRKPAAFLFQDGRRMGVDLEGCVFPTVHTSFLGIERPVLVVLERSASLAEPVSSLYFIEQRVPAFHRLIEKVEMDRMKNVTFFLKDGVIVHWTDLNEDEIVEAAENVLRLHDAYAPKKSPAVLKVVAPDRIVMDENWLPRSEQAAQGGPIVKS